MFVVKQWGRKLAMNRDQHQHQHQHQQHQQQHQHQQQQYLQLRRSSPRGQRTTRSAASFAYESENKVHVGRPRNDQSTSVSSSKPATSNHHQNDTREKRTIEKKELDPESGGQCKCRNCNTLANLTECSLCMESLQSCQIKSCPVCANVVCIDCASRITSCAFCRAEKAPERNRALERLVDKLLLPCKHYRSGCKVLVNGETRSVHESLCNYSTVVCPIGEGDCHWRGTIADVQSHLRNRHMLQPLQEHGFSMQFNVFRSKAKDTNSGIYTVCLSCYEQLFVVHLALGKHRLRMFFTQLGYEESQPLTTRPQRYGIFVSIRAQAGRRRWSLVPFGEHDRESREVSVGWKGLFPKGGPVSAKDIVEIDLLVKRLEES